MKTSQTLCSLLIVGILLGSITSATQAAPETQQQQRQSLHDAAQKGNYKDAYEGLRKLVLDPKVVSKRDDVGAYRIGAAFGSAFNFGKTPTLFGV